MGEAWMIGPFLLKEKWVLYAVAGGIAWLVMKLAISRQFFEKEQWDVLTNALIVFVVIWKLSYGLFHPISAWQHPIGMLYFSGGTWGILLGLIGVLGYVIIRYYRKKTNPHKDIMAGLLVYMTVYGSYQLSQAILYQQHVFPELLTAGSVLLLLIYWFMNQRKQPGYAIWPDMLLWFGLVQLVVTYLTAQVPWVAGFSKTQYVWLLITIGMIVMIYRQKQVKA